MVANWGRKKLLLLTGGFCLMMIVTAYRAPHFSSRKILTATLAPTPSSTIAVYEPASPIISITHKIVFLSDEGYRIDPGSLWVVSTDELSKTKLLDSVSQFAWVRNGQWLVAIHEGGLWLLSSDGGFLRRLVAADENRGIVERFSISPDNTKIAFKQSKGKFTYLSIFDIATNGITYIDINQGLRVFAWSPDSTKLAFTQNTGEASEPGYLKIADVNSMNLLQLEKGNPRYSWIRWSPDSQWIAVGLDVFDLEVAKVETSTIRIVESSSPGWYCGGVADDISWSPQSDRLAYSTYSNGRYSRRSVCIITASEGKRIQLDIGGHSSKPVWRKDGEGLYVVAHNFNPDVSDSEIDARILYFDKRGHFLTRLAPTFDSGAPAQLSLSPNGEWLSYMAGKNIQLVELVQNQQLTYTINTSGNLSGQDGSVYKWTSDSRNMVFLLRGGRTCLSPCGGLHMISVETGKVKKLTDEYSIENYAFISVYE